MQIVECGEGLQLKLQVVNARIIRVLPTAMKAQVFTDKDSKDKITKLSFYDFNLAVGDEIIVDNQKYKIKDIYKSAFNAENQEVYDLYTCQINKTCMYLLPMLGSSRDAMRWNQNLVSCFIGTEDWGTTESIYLWYRFDASKEHVKFEEELMQHPNFMVAHDVDKYHVLYEFSVPEHYKQDYYLIIDGKYSRIKEGLKEKIINFHKSSRHRPLGMILYRDPKLKIEMERELGVKISDDLDLDDPFYNHEELFLNCYKLSDTKNFKL